ncbi:MAG: hypothetical protein KDA89_01840, partial [Planctomycetaceae bacterium]|nr:hypothetical protein [Planctomycetaceae bacterium]
LTLSLLPEVSRGSGRVRDNGTPWNWPWLPWTPFVFIAAAVVFRSYALTMSFDPLSANGHYWDTIFGLYQLVPFAGVVLLLLLEIGITEQRPRLRKRVLLTAPLLLVMAYPWNVPWSHLGGYSAFTYSLIEQTASPVFLTLCGLVLFYGWAWYRGAASAELGVWAAAALLCWIGPDAFGHRIWRPGRETFAAWPIVVLSVLQLAIGLLKHRPWRVLTGTLLIVGAANLLSQGTPIARPWRGFATAHALLVIVIIFSRWKRIEWSEFLRLIAPPLLSLTMLFGMATLHRQGTDWLIVGSYAVGMTVLSWLLSRLLADDLFRRVALAHTVTGLAGSCVWGIAAFFRAPLPSGLRQVILAVLSFLTAVFISILKSGYFRKLRLRRLTRLRGL